MLMLGGETSDRPILTHQPVYTSQAPISGVTELALMVVRLVCATVLGSEGRCGPPSELIRAVLTETQAADAERL